MGPIQRRALGLGSTAGLALLASRVSAAEPTGSAEPRFEPQDDWLGQGGRRHRIVFDTLSTSGLALGINFANNFFTANTAGYGIEPDELSVVMVLRHNSTAFAFNNAMWEKHGEAFESHVALTEPRSKSVQRTNPFLSRTDPPVSAAGVTTLDGLIKQGTRFAVCAMAASSLAKAITGPSHGDPAAVLTELEANLVPNARMVPAGITAVNRAQEHGYTFSYCG